MTLRPQRAAVVGRPYTTQCLCQLTGELTIS